MNTNDPVRAGGIASLVMAATFAVGIAVFALFLTSDRFSSDDAVERVTFLVENQAVLTLWYMTIYLLFGAALVVLSVVLRDLLEPAAPAMVRVATAFGLIWAGLVLASGMIAMVGIDTVIELHARDPELAGSSWIAIETVQVGVGGGIELVGAIWVLLISWVALQVGIFSRTMNYVGIIIGLAGIITVVPALELFGALFGLGLIVWFFWVGIVLVRYDEAGRHPASSETHPLSQTLSWEK
jgi:hypothetical protein